MIQDIEDNYPDFLDDERGYSWDVWDVLPADVIRRHDAVLGSSAEALSKLDPAGLDDLDRWAYARASKRLGDVDGFLDAGRLILAAEQEHRGLDYPGIFSAVIETLARDGASDEARLLLEDLRERWPDVGDADRLQVWIELYYDEGQAEAAIDEVLAERTDDVELFFELCEDAYEAGRTELAARLLEQTEQAARRTGMSAVLVDVELLKERVAITEE